MIRIVLFLTNDAIASLSKSFGRLARRSSTDISLSCVEKCWSFNMSKIGGNTCISSKCSCILLYMAFILLDETLGIAMTRSSYLIYFSFDFIASGERTFMLSMLLFWMILSSSQKYFTLYSIFLNSASSFIPALPAPYITTVLVLAILLRFIKIL